MLAAIERGERGRPADARRRWPRARSACCSGSRRPLHPFSSHPSYPRARRAAARREGGAPARSGAAARACSRRSRRPALACSSRPFERTLRARRSARLRAADGAEHRRRGGAARRLARGAASTTCCSSSDGHALLYRPFLNYSGFNLDAIREMLLAPAHGARARRRGRALRDDLRRQLPDLPALALGPRPHARRAHSARAAREAARRADTAALVGLADRGRIAPGLEGRPQPDRPRRARHAPARDRLRPARRRQAPAPARDGLPRRRWSRARSRSRTASSTGALPGRLVRGPRAA